MTRYRHTLLRGAFGATLVALSVAAQPPAQDYLVFTVAESADQLALVRFGPKGTKVEREHKVGMMPTEINGPHGVAVSPDGKYYYVSIGHGTPYGTFWKYRTADGEVLGRTTLGLFPATIQLTADGALAFVVNFNLHGDMIPSSVSVVSTDEMVEIARITTCTMPHGSRINPAGTHQYSVCMMDDLLVEIDTRTLEVSRHFALATGKEQGMEGAPSATGSTTSPSRPMASTWWAPTSAASRSRSSMSRRRGKWRGFRPSRGWSTAWPSPQTVVSPS